MVIRPPGAIGSASALAACATADTIGVVAELTVAVKMVDWPDSTAPFCPDANAVTCICTVPALDGRQLPCQIPLPIFTSGTESPLEKVAFTPAFWGPSRLPQPSVTCMSSVVAWPTVALKVD